MADSKIIILSGLGGSGKSWKAMKLVEKALAQGRPVGGNLPVYWDKVKEHMLREHRLVIDDRQYFQLRSAGNAQDICRNIPEGALVVIDEAHKDFFSQDWAKFPRMLRELMCEARHWDLDMIYISQSWENLDASIKRLALYIVKCVNFGKWLGRWVPEQYRDRLERWLPLTLFVWCDGGEAEGKTIHHKELEWRDSKIHALYDSKSKDRERFDLKRADFTPPVKVPETKQERRKRMVKVLLIGGVLVVLAFSFVGGCRKVSKGVDKKTAPSAGDAVNSVLRGAGGSAPAPSNDVERVTGRCGSDFLATTRRAYFPGVQTERGKVVSVFGDSVLFLGPGGRPVRVDFPR